MAAPGKTGKAARRVVSAPLDRLDDFGHQMSFYVRAFAWTFRVLRRYRVEVLRLLAEVSLGTGGLAVIGGSVVIVGFMTFFTGSQVGLEGYESLAQLGAMRISDEIDALEVMAVPSMPFLVTTRMIAGMVAVIPLYVVGLLASY